LRFAQIHFSKKQCGRNNSPFFHPFAEHETCETYPKGTRGSLLCVTNERPSHDLDLIVLLTCHEQSPQLVSAQQFTATEMMVLLPVLFSHPDFCHYETLFASFSGGTTEADIEKARIRLLRAKERGNWDVLMRPVRNIISRARLKLHPIGITVLSLFEAGYVLEPFTDRSLGYKRIRARPGKGDANERKKPDTNNRR
jgi:hypothetical protein